jgi:hypothetical protein
MGHCNINDVLKLETVVDGMRIAGKEHFKCGVCTLGKMCQYQNHLPDSRATKPLELVHSDLAGPISPVLREGSNYVISLVDDYSALVMVYFLKT